MDGNNLATMLFDVLFKVKKSLRMHAIVEDFSASEMFVIGIVAKYQEREHEPMIQVKRISEIMKISRPAVNNIINHLEDRGLVERIRMKGDRKSVYIQLTDAAHQVYLSNRQQMITNLEEMIAFVGEQDVMELIRILNKLNEGIEMRNKTNA